MELKQTKVAVKSTEQLVKELYKGLNKKQKKNLIVG